MENYFKIAIKILPVFITIILVSCNEESVIQGVEPVAQAKIENISFNDLAIPINTKKPIEIQFDNNLKVTLDFIFYLGAVSSSATQYQFFNNPPTGFRWAMETYIKKFNSGTIVNSDDFVAGGTSYFVNAIYSKPTASYNYTYFNSFKVNEMSYAAFQFTSGTSTIIGWFRITPTDSKVILHECAYTTAPTIKIGSK